jgi:signal transduction histidine kinase
MKRVVVPALAAIVVICCIAAGVWLVLTGYVAASVAAQARLSAELLDARAPMSEAVARSLLRPGIHVLLIDRGAGTFVDAGNEGVRTHLLPPPGDFPGPPGGMPPPGAGPPGFAEAPPGAPGAGDPLAALRPRTGPFAGAALALAHIPPVRLERGERTIEIAPDARELGTWFAIDVAVFAFGTLATAGLAGARAAALARAERRALEARVAERREAADRYQRFLADIGHELRTPLTVMTGYVDILRTRESHAAQQLVDGRIVEGMHAETSRMRVLVEKMLTLARLESHDAVPRLVDVRDAVDLAARILQRRYPDRDVRIEADARASIVIDADDYAAALGNVLENAVKYAPDSPIAIAINVAGNSVTTSVADHGPGIAESDRAAIFERFYRGRSGGDGQGLGLGLAIVKRIAERWNGSVSCESDGGRTVFALTFPLADEETYGVAR